MKFKSTKAVLMAILGLGLFGTQLANAQEIEGGTFGNNKDIFVINSDESYDDAAIRLQTRSGSNYKDWNIWNNRQDGKLYFSYWQASSHSNSNENDYGTLRMVLQNNGNLGIGRTSASYRVHASGDIYADGGWLRVSGQRGLYFQSYGGGFYMTDNTWIRTYNNKSFYHNSGIMRTDGSFQVGNGGARFHVNSSGNVGIGDSSPDAKLDVAGSAIFDGHVSFSASEGRGVRFWNSDSYSINMGNSSEYKYGPVQDYSIKMNMNNDGDRGWTWGVDGQTPIAALATNGNMQIAGTLTANRITVNVGSFPDYVFADDYKLLSIEEVNRFIQTHKHLPNIPAAAEIEKTGMDLGKLNVLLTEKVEELTLYTIQQQDEIKSLKDQLQQINQLLEKQEALLQKVLEKKK